LIFISARLNLYAKRVFNYPVSPAVDIPKYRKIGVLNIALSIFIIILALIPILYAEGYISRLSNLLPGKEQLGDKLSLAIAFGLGAIISGVLGNAAYDLLKFVVRKIMEQNENG
jgi:uncharacterized membrane protein